MQQATSTYQPSSPTYGTISIEKAFEQKQSDVQVGAEGRVTRVLSDDNEGSRHQRFIVELFSGHTVLIAHNIDLAPRVADLKVGDRVSFYGEYEWNPQGGVVHWTHHDPAGRHEGGWVELNGVRFE
jgi:hypothetical protein